jgi:two-component system, chemotaxis family, sensor kinase Cph1
MWRPVICKSLSETWRVVCKCWKTNIKNKLDDRADQYIHYAVEGAVRMKGLIQDSLEYSRIATRRKPSRIIDCEQLLDLTMKNLRAAGADSGAVITRDPLPAISADETQMLPGWARR